MPRKEYDQNLYVTNYGTEAADTGYTVSPSSTPDGSPAYYGTQIDQPGYVPTQAAGNEGANDIGKTEIADQFTVGGETLRPVVGWLVCIKGACKGKDFRLHSEHNYIGRGDTVDVNLPDNKISRGAAFQIAYDPISRAFYVAACSGVHQNSYHNGRLLMSDRELHTNDLLKVGDTEMIFIPLCGEHFDWDDLNAEAK